MTPAEARFMMLSGIATAALAGSQLVVTAAFAATSVRGVWRLRDAGAWPAVRDGGRWRCLVAVSLGWATANWAMTPIRTRANRIVDTANDRAERDHIRRATGVAVSDGTTTTPLDGIPQLRRHPPSQRSDDPRSRTWI